MPVRRRKLVEPLDTLIAYKMIAVDPTLSSAEKAVAATIVDHFHRETGRCDPSIGRLVHLLGVDRRTILRSVEALDRRGLVRKLRHGGRGSRNLYEPVWAAFHHLEGAWKTRFNTAREAVTGASPEQWQGSHLAGDGHVTQTLAGNNPSISQPICRDPVRNLATPEMGEAKYGLSRQKEEHRSATLAALASATALRTTAERRWSSELHARCVGDVEIYATVIGVIDMVISQQATEAEAERRGAGLRVIAHALAGTGITLPGPPIAPLAPLSDRPTGSGGVPRRPVGGDDRQPGQCPAREGRSDDVHGSSLGGAPLAVVSDPGITSVKPRKSGLTDIDEG